MVKLIARMLKSFATLSLMFKCNFNNPIELIVDLYLAKFLATSSIFFLYFLLF